MIWCHRRSARRPSHDSESSSDSAQYVELDNRRSPARSCIRVIKKSHRKRSDRRRKVSDPDTTEPDYEDIDDPSDSDISTPCHESDDIFVPEIVETWMHTEVLQNVEVRFTDVNFNFTNETVFCETNQSAVIVPPLDILANGATFIFHAGMDLLLRNLSAVLWYTVSKMQEQQKSEV